LLRDFVATRSRSAATTWAKVGKARALGDRRGRVKFVLDARTGVVLGAHILAHHGGDLLPGPMVAMNAPGGTLAPLLATTHPHPTLSEAVKVTVRNG
jgi:pyruvate/2-oxoglutarate dehydrogenase complex dihydrolipoamide dehydrogenase (E3) component